MLVPGRLTAALACLGIALSIPGCSSCDDTPPAPEAVPPGPPDRAGLAGRWRGVLQTPGGELPFGLTIHEEGHDPPAELLNGEGRDPISAVTLDGERVTFEIAIYDARITATLSSRDTIEGSWQKVTPQGTSELPFAATRGDTRRFGTRDDSGEPGIDDVAGTWRAVFTHDGSETLARAELESHEGGRVTGTFLTATGDYRFLEGDYGDGLLRLSTFDGASAGLFHARARGDGTLAGDFWARDGFHAAWTATPYDPATDPPILPDPYGVVRVVSEDQKLRFSFPDVDGNVVTLPSERFDGKVVVVDVFGTWCHNCNDEAPLLARWHQRFRDRGLEVVGLAFEYTDDVERSRRLLRTYAARFGIDFPLLIAGQSGGGRAAAALPDLSGIESFPTTILVGRDGRVRAIHSGFEGPATGQHYLELVGSLTSKIERLLEEPPPAQ